MVFYSGGSEWHSFGSVWLRSHLKIMPFSFTRCEVKQKNRHCACIILDWCGLADPTAYFGLHLQK